MKYNFPYLNDIVFLKQLDAMKIKEQFAKIVVLNFNDESPIAEIQGKVTGGSLTLNGDSAMRRACNITMLADEYENDLTDTKNLLSINKKVQILIGITNLTGQYQSYPILWFPQGVFVIITPNISHSNSGLTISLNLQDKMALLNGTCGGTFPASILLNEIEDVDEDGNITITQPSIFQIIQELVNHFGGQQLGKIIISDIDNRIKKVMKWRGSIPIYLYSKMQSDGTWYYRFSTNRKQLEDLQQQQGGSIRQFSYGDDIGYVYADFAYPGELVANAGQTIVSVLDKIKNLLGNYEYFYDVEGNFRFQQIKNYLNTSYSTNLINEIEAKNYLVDYSSGKSVYTFEDAEIIQSYTNAPQYQQIKNDFVVWGKRKTISGTDRPIRYHLAIDKKPEVGNTYEVFFYTDPDDGLEKAKKPLDFASRSQFPEKGAAGQFYRATDTGIIYQWDAAAKLYKQTDYQMESITTSDYRTELYLSGVMAQPFGLDSNYYFTELKTEWPKIYDIRNGKFYDEAVAQPSDLDFFLDLIDTTSDISEFGVENIGRRTNIISEDSVNCIFEPGNPDIVLIESGSDTAEKERQECDDKNQAYSQVDTAIYSMLVNGGSLRSAYDQIKKDLYQYTSYNEQISLSVIPIYYLEPNIRITVNDPQAGIYGDYIVKSITMPLDTNSAMNLTCTRAMERNV